MAYDKVIDSAALDTQLTSIADAIRAKTGGSNSLVFPDGFLQAIAAIEAGGGSGGGDGGWAIDGFTLLSGSFTPEADITSGNYKINVGTYTTKPTQVYSALYIIDGFPDSSTTKHGVAAIGTTMKNDGSYSNCGAYLSLNSLNTVPAPSALGASSIARAMNGELYMSIYTNECILKAGTTYAWIFIHN